MGCLNGCGGQAVRQGAEREAQNRERGHFFGVSHCGERLGSNPAGLTALSRNVCDWRPGWGHHCAAPCASKAERPRDVICLMESVVVFLLHHGMCFHFQQRRPRCSPCFVYVLTFVLYYLGKGVSVSPKSQGFEIDVIYLLFNFSICFQNDTSELVA